MAADLDGSFPESQSIAQSRGERWRDETHITTTTEIAFRKQLSVKELSYVRLRKAHAFPAEAHQYFQRVWRTLECLRVLSWSIPWFGEPTGLNLDAFFTLRVI